MLSWQIYVILAYLLCLSGQLADSITTEAGAAHGGKETNKYAAWIISKVGVTGLSLLKCMLLPALGIVGYWLQGWKGFAAWEIPMGIIGWIFGTINARRLRAAGQSIF